MTKDNLQLYALSALSAVSFFLIALVTGSFLRVFTVASYVYSTAISMVLLLFTVSVLQVVLFRRFATVSFYLGLMQSVTFFTLTLISFPGPLFPLFLFAFLLEAVSVAVVWKMTEGRVIRTAVALISLSIMIYLGNLFQFAFNRPDTGIVVASTESVFIALGQNIPFLEYNGLFIFTHHFDLILSFQQYIMFLVLVILISENYHHIIRFVSRHGRKGGKASMIVYGLTGALSCQCESYISFLPALSILLINYILFPVIIFSILLLSATYLIVSGRYMKERGVRLFSSSFYSNRKLLIIAASFVFLMGTPLFITLVVYLSLLKSALYFFLSGMIMILDGYVLVTLLSLIFSFRPIPGRYNLLLVAAGTVAAFVWFIPSFTHLAFEYPLYFVLMNITMLLSGLIFGLVHTLVETRWKDVLNEYISTVFGLFSLVVFYFMVTFQISIWNFFTIESQIEFLLLTWTIMLPVMWITTQISLNRLATEKRTDKLYLDSVPESSGS